MLFRTYDIPAITIESSFRRFVFGLDPIIQPKCHQHGAATMEVVLRVKGNVFRKLCPSPADLHATTQSVAPPAPQGEPLSGMVSSPT